MGLKAILSKLFSEKFIEEHIPAGDFVSNSFVTADVPAKTITIVDGIVTAVTGAQVGTPGNFAAAVISDTQINLSWDAVPGATNYILQRGLLANHSDAAQIYSGPLLVFNNTGLVAETHYYYRVKAQKSGTNPSYADSAYANDDDTTQAAP